MAVPGGNGQPGRQRPAKPGESTAGRLTDEPRESGLAVRMRRPISQSKTKPDSRERLRLWGARVLFWALVCLTAGGLVVGALLLLNRVLIARNPCFVLQRISLQGQRSITEQAVSRRLAEAGAVIGKANLMALPMRRLRETLERDPLIARAELVRRLPDLLEVSVVERIPLAVLRTRAPCFIDDEGVVLPWRDLSKERLLPAITAVRNVAGLTPGAKVQDEALLGAVRFLRLVSRRADGTAYDVELIQLDYLLPSLQVHLRPRGIFVQGAVIVVPVQGMEEAMDRLRDIHRIRTASNSPTSFVDVTYRTNVPVRP